MRMSGNERRTRYDLTLFVAKQFVSRAGIRTRRPLRAKRINSSVSASLAALFCLEQVHCGGGVSNDNDPDGHRQDATGDPVGVAVEVQGDSKLFFADAAGGRRGQLLQFPHAEAGVCRADDRRAVLRVRGEQRAVWYSYYGRNVFPLTFLGCPSAGLHYSTMLIIVMSLQQ